MMQRVETQGFMFVIPDWLVDAARQEFGVDAVKPIIEVPFYVDQSAQVFTEPECLRDAVYNMPPFMNSRADRRARKFNRRTNTEGWENGKT